MLPLDVLEEAQLLLLDPAVFGRRRRGVPQSDEAQSEAGVVPPDPRDSVTELFVVVHPVALRQDSDGPVSLGVPLPAPASRDLSGHVLSGGQHADDGAGGRGAVLGVEVPQEVVDALDRVEIPVEAVHAGEVDEGEVAQVGPVDVQVDGQLRDLEATVALPRELLGESGDAARHLLHAYILHLAGVEGSPDANRGLTRVTETHDQRVLGDHAVSSRQRTVRQTLQDRGLARGLVPDDCEGGDVDLDGGLA